MKKSFSMSHLLFCILGVLALIVMWAFCVLLAALLAALWVKVCANQMVLGIAGMILLFCFLVLALRAVFFRWRDAVFFDGILCPVHLWDGCTCRICGTKRNLNHTWKHCVCEKCGARRDDDHVWQGCTCAICGTHRDEGHTWQGCACTVCGAHRDEAHSWDGCKCTVCGKVREEGHTWDKTACVCTHCRKEKHVWEFVREYTTETFPDGVDPCTENMCFLESTTYREYRCNKCGSVRAEEE